MTRLDNSCLDRQGLDSVVDFGHLDLGQILSNVSCVDIPLELANEEKMWVGKECGHDQAQEIKCNDVHDELRNVGNQADHDRPDLVLGGTVNSNGRAQHADDDEANNGGHDAVGRALHLRHGLDGLVTELIVLNVLVEVGIGVGHIDGINDDGTSYKQHGQWNGENERNDVDPDDGSSHVAATSAAVGCPSSLFGDDGRGDSGGGGGVGAHDVMLLCGCSREFGYFCWLAENMWNVKCTNVKSCISVHKRKVSKVTD